MKFKQLGKNMKSILLFEFKYNPWNKNIKQFMSLLILDLIVKTC
jgi:hypothetical protein